MTIKSIDINSSLISLIINTVKLLPIDSMSDIKKLIIPKTITTFGSYITDGCTQLEEINIYVANSTEITKEDSAFKGHNVICQIIVYALNESEESSQ